jgi:membrane protease YdiL (CAAX protease family)
LLLLWYLCRLNGKEIFPAKIRSGDAQSLIIALPGLLGIGLGVSVLSSIVPLSEIAIAEVEAPGKPAAWILMIASCLSTGYLEETYFRRYLLDRLCRGGARAAGAFLPQKHGLAAAAAALYAKTGPLPGILASAALFSLCHVYEGPWGVINAALAGVFLSLIYIHYGALHGLAWAHGLYNIFIYVSGA